MMPPSLAPPRVLLPQTTPPNAGPNCDQDQPDMQRALVIEMRAPWLSCLFSRVWNRNMVNENARAEYRQHLRMCGLNAEELHQAQDDLVQAIIAVKTHGIARTAIEGDARTHSTQQLRCCLQGSVP